MMKDATEEERTQIIETMLEIVLPEDMIGGVTEGTVPADARAKVDAYRVSVGEEIRARRKALRMTQADLARKAGIPQSHVSRLEHGKHAPSYLTIERIAGALKVKPSQLDPGFSED